MQGRHGPDRAVSSRAVGNRRVWFAKDTRVKLPAPVDVVTTPTILHELNYLNLSIVSLWIAAAANLDAPVVLTEEV